MEDMVNYYYFQYYLVYSINVMFLMVCVGTAPLHIIIITEELVFYIYFLILLLLSYFSEPRANDPTRQKNYQKLDSRSIQLMTFILRLAVYHHRNLETNKNIMDYLGNHSLFLGCFTSQIIHDNKDNKMNLISNNISF